MFGLIAVRPLFPIKKGAIFIIRKRSSPNVESVHNRGGVFQHLFFLFPSVIFFDSEMDYLFNNNNTGLKNNYRFYFTKNELLMQN